MDTPDHTTTTPTTTSPASREAGRADAPRPLTRAELIAVRRRMDIAALTRAYDESLAESDGTAEGEAAARRTFIERARGTTALVVGGLTSTPHPPPSPLGGEGARAPAGDKARLHLLACIECGRWLIDRLKKGDPLARVSPISDEAWAYLTGSVSEPSGSEGDAAPDSAPEGVVSDQLIAPLDLMDFADQPSRGEADRYVVLACAAEQGRWGDLSESGERLPASLEAAEIELGIRDADGALQHGWGA